MAFSSQGTRTIASRLSVDKPRFVPARWPFFAPAVTGVTASVGQAEKSRHGGVFVEVRPVESETRPDQLPVAALFLGGVTQAGEPLDRYGQGPAVFKMRHEGVGDELQSLGPGRVWGPNQI